MIMHCIEKATQELARVDKWSRTSTYGNQNAK